MEENELLSKIVYARITEQMDKDLDKIVEETNKTIIVKIKKSQLIRMLIENFILQNK